MRTELICKRPYLKRANDFRLAELSDLKNIENLILDWNGFSSKPLMEQIEACKRRAIELSLPESQQKIWVIKEGDSFHYMGFDPGWDSGWFLDASGVNRDWLPAEAIGLDI